MDPITFKHLTSKQLKQIIRHYNLSHRIPLSKLVDGKRKRLTKDELAKELDKHLIIDNDTIRRKEINYMYDMPKMQQKEQQNNRKIIKKIDIDKELRDIKKMTDEIKKEKKEIEDEFKNIENLKEIKETTKNIIENVIRKNEPKENILDMVKEYKKYWDKNTLKALKKRNELTDEQKLKIIDYLKKEMIDAKVIKGDILTEMRKYTKEIENLEKLRKSKGREIQKDELKNKLETLAGTRRKLDDIINPNYRMIHKLEKELYEDVIMRKMVVK